MDPVCLELSGAFRFALPTSLCGPMYEDRMTPSLFSLSRLSVRGTVDLL